VQVNRSKGEAGADAPANKVLMAAAAALLLIPNVGLLWVGSYAREEPIVAGFPFFIWYQFAWVFLCSACTATALRLIRRARPRRTGGTR
jgi:membrane protein implicated in regulation of membrane protease activity